MVAGEGDEVIYVRTDGLYTALHRGDGIALTLQADTDAPDSAEFLIGYAGCTAAVHAMEIAAEDKYFVIEKCGEAARSIVRALFAVKDAWGRASMKVPGSGEIIGICHNDMVLCLDAILHLLNISEIGPERTCRLLLAYCLPI